MTLREDLEMMWQRPGCAQPLHYARVGRWAGADGFPQLVKGRPALCAASRPAVVWPDPPPQPLPSSLPRRRAKKGAPS